MGYFVGRNYHAILEPRFHGLLARWLKKLPADAWVGTPRELAAALYEESMHGEYVGRNVVGNVKAGPTLAQAGFTVMESRTAARRMVAVRRTGAAGDKSNSG